MPINILLRSSWQSINIGDIGHTPGALAILQHHIPTASITLWPNALSPASRELLTRNFPNLQIAEGTLDDHGIPTTPALKKAWEHADIYLSNSGSGFPAHHHAAAFHHHTKKPVAVFPVSADPISGFQNQNPEGGTLEQIRQKAAQLPPTHLPENLRTIINAAAFMFTRDTISRDYLRAQNVKTPILDFAPDAQLAMTLRDDKKAEAYLHTHHLEPQKFICIIPRLRYTPYHKIHNTPPTDIDRAKDAINARTQEPDHAKLRNLITRYVRATGHKVLACPEMTYEIDLAKESLIDPLPPEIKPHIIWRNTFWLPDEAASIYAHAAAVISLECHSPLIALHNQTPAIHLRQPTDTCKAQMYIDLGIPDWLLEIDPTTPDQLWSPLEKILTNPTAAKLKTTTLMSNVNQLHHGMANCLATAIRPQT